MNSPSFYCGDWFTESLQQMLPIKFNSNIVGDYFIESTFKSAKRLTGDITTPVVKENSVDFF